MSLEKHRTTRLLSGRQESLEDILAVEEALEIHVDGAPYAVTMRLPGDDLALVAGFCLTEGLVRTRSDLADIARCDLPGGENRVRIVLAPDRLGEAARRRREVHQSRTSCGICGKQLMVELAVTVPPAPRRVALEPDVLLAMQRELVASQRIFPVTGATHGAALFDAGGTPLAFAEDVGRHNALDKVIGTLLLSDRLASARVAVVSSRLSFEMVQKAAVAGLEILAGVSAATTLAVRLAEAQQLTLVGFLREDRMNIYTHPDRIRCTQGWVAEPAGVTPEVAVGLAKR